MPFSDRAAPPVRTGSVVTADVEVVTASPQWLPEGLRLLDEVERARLDRLRPPLLRSGYLTRHVLARLVLGERTGTPPEALRFSRDCATCDQQHGKPRLVSEPGHPYPAIAFSLSGTTASGAAASSETSSVSGLVAVAVLTGLSVDGGPAPAEIEPAVGVDLETVAGTGYEGFDEVALHSLERDALDRLPPAERSVARAVWWARKEAVVKALGVGLRRDPTTLAMSPPGAPFGWLETPDLPRLAVGDLDLQDQKHTNGPGQTSAGTDAVVGAVCVLGADRVRVVHRSGAALLTRFGGPST